MWTIIALQTLKKKTNLSLKLRRRIVLDCDDPRNQVENKERNPGHVEEDMSNPMCIGKHQSALGCVSCYPHDLTSCFSVLRHLASSS